MKRSCCSTYAQCALNSSNPISNPLNARSAVWDNWIPTGDRNANAFNNVVFPILWKVGMCTLLHTYQTRLRNQYLLPNFPLLLKFLLNWQCLQYFLWGAYVESAAYVVGQHKISLCLRHFEIQKIVLVFHRKHRYFSKCM